MPGHSLVRRLLPIGVLVCVASCLSTEGYYRYQDGGSSGAAGNGAAGTSAGTAGVVGTGGSTGGSTAGTAGTTTTGRGGTTGAAGAAAGRGGTTGTAGAGAGGRGGTTGTAGATGTGGAGTVLFMDDFESGVTMPKWDFGAISPTPPVIMDGSKAVMMTEVMGKQAIGAAGMAPWTNYSVEARVKVTATSGTSSSDGVSICARLTSTDSFYYLQLNNSGDTKVLKIKFNNGSNTSLSSSLDSSGFALNTWVTLRLDVQGSMLTAYLNGTMRGSYPVTDSSKLLTNGGIGLMVQNTTAEFDDVVVRALP